MKRFGISKAKGHVFVQNKTWQKPTLAGCSLGLIGSMPIECSGTFVLLLCSKGYGCKEIDICLSEYCTANKINENTCLFVVSNDLRNEWKSMHNIIDNQAYGSFFCKSFCFQLSMIQDKNSHQFHVFEISPNDALILKKEDTKKTEEPKTAEIKTDTKPDVSSAQQPLTTASDPISQEIDKNEYAILDAMGNIFENESKKNKNAVESSTAESGTVESGTVEPSKKPDEKKAEKTESPATAEKATDENTENWSVVKRKSRTRFPLPDQDAMQEIYEEMKTKSYMQDSKYYIKPIGPEKNVIERFIIRLNSNNPYNNGMSLDQNEIRMFVHEFNPRSIKFSSNIEDDHVIVRF